MYDFNAAEKFICDKLHLCKIILAKHSMYALLPIIVACLLTTACQNRPRNVISRSKMENVLHDYHLAQGIIAVLPDSESYKQDKIIEAVFEKHNITKADFDSSMIWYNRNAKELSKIYENLRDRFEEENKEMQLKQGSNNMVAAIGLEGDTTNIWNGNKLFLLRNKPYLDHTSFSIDADTSFHRFDKFILNAECIFISESKESQNRNNIIMSLSVTYENGITVSTYYQVYGNNSHQLVIRCVENSDIKKVSGFFFFNNAEETRNMAFVKNVLLYREHTKQQQNDTEKADSLKADSIKEAEQIRKRQVTDKPKLDVSPDELRKLKKSEDRIEIKTAPDPRPQRRRRTR